MKVFIILFLLTISVTIDAFSSEVVNFQLAQIARQVKPFEGVYTAVSERSGEELLISVAAKNGKLELSTLAEFDQVPRMITIDLLNTFEVREVKGRNIGKATQTTQLIIFEDTLTRTVVQENRLRKMEEIESLQLNGETLIHTFKRKYFKRKFGVAGPWVVDTTSFNGDRNSFHVVESAQRTSNKGLTHQEMDNIGRQRVEYVYQLKNQQGVPTREGAREAVRQGLFVRVKAADQQFHFNNVVTFPASSCARLFSSR